MDPITLEKLLPIADRIETNREGIYLSRIMFSRIIAEQTKAKDQERRERDIKRVFVAMAWIDDSPDCLKLGDKFFQFIEAWNTNNLLQINERLSDYPPYAQFLATLRDRISLHLPQTKDEKIALRQSFGINFAIFDTFRNWAIAAGQAYLSPFNQSIYWGGAWGEYIPLPTDFMEFCWKNYIAAAKTSGYANIGRLADGVCRQLNISFQAFEMKMVALIKNNSKSIFTSQASIREPSRAFQVITIRPRLQVIKERFAAKLNNDESYVPKWLDRRYVEDGIRINNELVKLIRWEGHNDNT